MEIQKEFLEKVNSLIEKKNKEAEVEEKNGLFGETGRKVEEMAGSVIETVEGLSAGEILLLMIGLVLIGYYLDKIIKGLYRILVLKNFRIYEAHFKRTEEESGKDRFWRLFWIAMEEALEKIWIPLWCQGKRIRRQVIMKTIDEDIEAFADALGVPNNTRATVRSPDPKDKTRSPSATASALNETFGSPLRPEQIWTSPKKDLDEERKRFEKVFILVRTKHEVEE